MVVDTFGDDTFLHCTSPLCTLKEYTLIKIADAWTAKARDRATSGRRPRDKRHKRKTEKCPIIMTKTEKG